MSKAIEFGVVADRIVAISGAVHYLWVAGIADNDFEGRRRAREEYEAAHPGVNVKSLSGICADYDTDRAYLFYVADCFDPGIYLIFGASFEDAYDTFITAFEQLVKIAPEDYGDYDEDTVKINDNGTAIDDEAVQYLRIDRLLVTDRHKGAE